jgi:hypothetical protein
LQGDNGMRKFNSSIVSFVTLCFFVGCASIDTQVVNDFRNSVKDTVEIGYGIGHGDDIKLLGKISEKAEIDHFINNLKFRGKSEMNPKRILTKYIFFMYKNRAMTVVRLEGEKLQYQFSDYTLSKKSIKFIEGYFN